jgi:transposase InsO family protein
MQWEDHIFAINSHASEDNRMCVLQGHVTFRSYDYPARILLDSGADRQYVSAEFVRKAGLEVDTSRNHPKLVKVANGAYEQVPGEASFTLVMSGYNSRIHARVLNLPDFDIILGFDWLRTVNPIIDWRTLRIQVSGRGGELHELLPAATNHYVDSRPLVFTADTEDAHDPLSANQAAKWMRHPEVEAYVFVVRKEMESEPDVTPINFSSNESLTRGQPPTPPSKSSELIRTLPPGIKQLLKEFEDCLREKLPPELPPSRGYEHTIDTGEATPINLNSYPLSPIHLKEQSQQIADLLKQGFIEESSSPWGFPVLFVKKPGGKWRMCIDFRALNAVTKKNGYPLPRIQECIDLIGRAKVLSKLDFTQGYYQMLVDERDREKTAFNTREGKFQWKVMPFGLCNAPASFQTFMNRILRPFIGKFVVVYLDDIVVYSNTTGEHVQHLTQIFEVLRKHTLYAKPSKCIFASPLLEFCGHLVGGGTIRPLSSKVAIIVEWPTPTNVHEVRVFIGMVTYYRRFIRAFAKICVPLFDLLKEADAETRKKKFRKIIWTASTEIAFSRLKQLLTEEPILLQPDTTRAFIIETDASEWAIGIVLLQLHPETGRLHPVAYDGRKLSPAEINYPVHEKELLAIKYALQTWRIYIDNGHTTIIYTDHESLKYLATMRNPTKRLARWIEEFGEFNLSIQYRKGSDNAVPDAISRRPDLMGEGPRNRAAVIASIRGFDEDEWARHMTALLAQGIPPPEKYREDIYEHKDEFTVDNEENLTYTTAEGATPYIPQLFRADLLERMHTEYGHLGYPGLQGVMTGRGWWPNLEKDIRNYARICPQCQVAQRARPGQEREIPRTLASDDLQLFDRWAIDLIGILPKTPAGNCWIFTAIEYMTGWPVTRALPDARAETIATVIHDDITMVYGPPKELLSDNGSNLTGEVMKAYTTLLGTKHRVTTPYHPRTNGMVENFNGLLGNVLTKMLVNQPTILWDQYLMQATFSIRIRIHSSKGKSPYSLLFGRDPRLPSDNNELRPLAHYGDQMQANLDRIEQMQHARMVANKKLVEKAIKARQLREDSVKLAGFKNGDWVLVRAENRQKFEGRWFGPYKVIEANVLGTYRLQDPSEMVVKTLINGQRLVPAHVQGEDIKGLWNSSKIQGTLRKRKITLNESSPEVAEIFEKENADTPSYDELASIPAKEWKKLMEERSGERSVQVGEGSERNASLPTAADLEALEQGIREGLTEGPTVEELQDTITVEPRVPVRMVNEPFAIPRIEEESSQELQLSHTADKGLDLMDIPQEDNTGLQSETAMDIEIPEVTTGSDLLRDTSISDLMEDIVAPPSEPKAARIPSWKRELAASTSERERTMTSYGLRNRPSKKSF